VNRACLETRLSSEDVLQGNMEEKRKWPKRKPRSYMLHLLSEQEDKKDQLQGAKERSEEPGRMASSSLEPALRQSTQGEEVQLHRKLCIGISPKGHLWLIKHWQPNIFKKRYEE